MAKQVTTRVRTSYVMSCDSLSVRKECMPGVFRADEQAQSVTRRSGARIGVNCLCQCNRGGREVCLELAMEATLRFMPDEYRHLARVAGSFVCRQEKGFKLGQRLTGQHGVTEVLCEPCAHHFFPPPRAYRSAVCTRGFMAQVSRALRASGPAKPVRCASPPTPMN